MQRAAALQTLILTTSHRDKFGQARDIPVLVLERNEVLLELHTRLLYFCAEHRLRPVDFTYVSASYRPHITMREDMEVRWRYVADRIALIVRGPDSPLKRVFGIHPLGQRPPEQP